MLSKHWILFRIQTMKDGINSLSSTAKAASKQTHTGPHMHQQKLQSRSSSIIHLILAIIFCIATCFEFANADQGKYISNLQI